MAIRDRITVKTKDGTITVISVTRQGGHTEVENKPRDNVVIVSEYGASAKGDPIRFLTVPIDQIVFVLSETDIPNEKPKRARKKRAAEEG